MENASKALIIAGAILLSILLISLGILIYTQAQDTVTNSGMSEASISAFNNKIVKYEGENVKGTTVKNLISEINAINSNESNQSSNIFVDISTNDSSHLDLGEAATGSSAQGDEIHTYKTNDIKNTLSYTVSVDTYASDGRINAIIIDPNIT